jgi:hypothetical protein
MKKLFLLLLIVFLFDLGQYSVGQMMTDPPLRYDGQGRAGSPLALYNPVNDAPIYIPLENGKFMFDFEGVIYRIDPLDYLKIQVYRREP